MRAEMTRKIIVNRHQILRSVLLALVCYTAFHILYLSPKPRNLVQKTANELSSDLDGFPKDVYYFWCENKLFEYRHYLSVLSVFFHLNPYRVRLFYKYEPVTQERRHNTWLTELRHDRAFFSIDKMPENWCANKQQNIDEYLSKHGGFYVHEEVIIGGSLDEEWLQSIDSAKVTADDTKVQLLQISRRKSNVSTSTSRAVSSTTIPMRLINGMAQLKECQSKNGTVETTSSRPTNDSSAAFNVVLFRAVVPVVPENIWELDSEVGRLLRTAAYGKPEIARPVQDFSHLAPNIAHVIWSNNDPMSFEFYLCVLSLLDVAKLDNVIIHGDGPPTGRYWDLIKDHPNLRLVLRTLIDGDKENVYGNAVKVRAHVADVLRLDIMNRYGGLYVDTDAIFFRPLTRELRAYDVVVSPDISPQDKGFPNVYQNGIMLGKPGARFWRYYLESYRKFYDNDWLWNCNFGLYIVKERHPETLLNEPRLNTICLNRKCYPYWKPHGSDGPADIVRDWRNNTFAIHNCFPHLEEHSSPEALLKNNGSTLFGAVAMYVLEQSGKLDFFRKLANNITKQVPSL